MKFFNVQLHKINNKKYRYILKICKSKYNYSYVPILLEKNGQVSKYLYNKLLNISNDVKNVYNIYKYLFIDKYTM